MTIFVRAMNAFGKAGLAAVLGPTNTGKTHLAVERLVAHSSGMIGFPLRLLAREVYDRVVAIRGPREVALVTGEERIVPPGARWFLCTAESMPVDRDLAFVAIDEGQLGADPERGHVFTDRMLRARGRDETMILGSDSLRPMIRALLPEAELVARPRFSTLSYAGARKLSRLPRRSAIVAFSAEEVYAVAEALRRLRGGAAVVMGALSPSTRNAQVAMFQSGEVDYLVATDAIGMGLNLDVAHVAFASLHKFDGRRRRRLTLGEMAQIAGRAGRHQRDGTFGALHEQGPDAFTPEEVMAIEEHAVPPLEHLFWRKGDPELSSIGTLIGDLERKPDHRVLRAAPEAVDLAVLRRLADLDWVRDRVRSPAMVRRLWAACGVPDFRKLGADPHARFVARIFGHLSEGAGHIPHQWFAAEVARLESVEGDVETVAGRIASVRSWAYIAQRSDWLADADHWAGRVAEVEQRLSDALHAKLTQRFVDRRTTALLRQVGDRSAVLPVEIGPEGEVLVDAHPIGTMRGFHFAVAADARAGDKRLLLATAERHLGAERSRLARALAAAPDGEFALGERGDPELDWRGTPVAQLVAGAALTRPGIRLDRALASLSRDEREAVQQRLMAYVADAVRRQLPALARLEADAADPKAAPELRAVAAALADGGGIVPRDRIEAPLAQLAPADRKRLRQARLVIGALDLFDPQALRPGGARLRAALLAARDGVQQPPIVEGGATVLPAEGGKPSGFRRIGGQAVRIDMIERIARGAHDARAGRGAFQPDRSLATSIGLSDDTYARLMRRLGFRQRQAAPGEHAWVWRGRQPVRDTAPQRPDNPAFAALAVLRGDG